MENTPRYSAANGIEPWKHGDGSRRVIVSTWFGAEGCGEEIVEVFQMAPMLLEHLIIMTFLRVISAPLIKKTCVSDVRQKKKTQQHSNFFLVPLNKASVTPKLGVLIANKCVLQGTGVFKIDRRPTWGTATRNNPPIVLSKWTQTQKTEAVETSASPGRRKGQLMSCFNNSTLT